ncbi:hypothetical protein [Armatimonas sp.]|uniref:hypothetical protein n=1 Tax=Armatimonas sp. TaxID=1872638 RepID=UPI00286BF1F4|nr:hypothetical protein [Armatimonas sp.]
MDDFTDEWLETTLRAALAEEPAPSQETLTFAVGLARMLPRADRPSLLARLVSGGQTLATARGGEAQQRLYETDQHLITLWDEADSGASRYLIGQVYEKNNGPLVPESVMLFSAQCVEKNARQEGSEFHVAGVAPGVYALRCSLATADILLPGVEVGG